MEFAGRSVGAIINPRYRRSAVLRALLENLASSRDGSEVKGMERTGPATDSGGTGNGNVPPEGGEEDEGAGVPRTAAVQRNI